MKHISIRPIIIILIVAISFGCSPNKDSSISSIHGNKFSFKIDNLNSPLKKTFKSQRISNQMVICNVTGNINGRIKFYPRGENIEIGPGDIDTIIKKIPLLQGSNLFSVIYEPIDDNLKGKININIEFR